MSRTLSLKVLRYPITSIIIIGKNIIINYLIVINYYTFVVPKRAIELHNFIIALIILLLFK